MTGKLPPCTYCGATLEEGQPGAGWGTMRGPGSFKDCHCPDCKGAHFEAWDKAKREFEWRRVGLSPAPVPEPAKGATDG